MGFQSSTVADCLVARRILINAAICNLCLYAPSHSCAAMNRLYALQQSVRTKSVPCQLASRPMLTNIDITDPPPTHITVNFNLF